MKDNIISNNPYEEFTALKAWNVLDKAIKKLQQNNDMIIQTPNEYVVGYLLSALSQRDLLKHECNAKK